ncbi:CATSPER1 [Symbiodinium necroappetens]|uniref:CATSPER1 protein n=1 Tax=Symbiodinium necroappetens TaxID=1628268 RepID=A0A812PGM0_9DINO|nr:CATSPER1 [Symbiodinium necroappetens]
MQPNISTEDTPIHLSDLEAFSALPRAQSAVSKSHSEGSNITDGSVASDASDVAMSEISAAWSAENSTTGVGVDESRDTKRTKDTKDSSGSRKKKKKKHRTTNCQNETVAIILRESSQGKLKRSSVDICVESVARYLDHVAGALVLLNSVLLMLQLEMEGRHIAHSLGLHAERQNFDGILPTFQVMDSVFVFIFLAELLIRIVLERWKFVKDIANWLDFILVAGGLVDMTLTLAPSAAPGDQDMVTLRFVSALKAFRAIRMVRSFRFSPGLRMLVKACQCCLPSLCWSMLLLAVFMCMGALILGNLLQDFIKDETRLLEDRLWVWNRYGTTYRAFYTLYEITFAGNWPSNVRPILEKVSHAYVIFYFLYVTIIVFAVIRVISAIFLKDTLDEANNDAQHLVLDRLRKREAYVERLEGLFNAIIDDEGREAGILTEKRLAEILANPRVKAYFSTLEIDVQEGAALFHLLDNGHGEVTLDDFISGIMRCKGAARAIDTFALQNDVKQLDAKLQKLLTQLMSNQIVVAKGDL